MSVRLRPMTLQDVPEAVRLKDLAGWNQTALDWQRFFSANPQGCFAAEHEGRIIGTAATIAFAGRLAWIGMVIVDPEYRAQGIGKALLQRAVEYLDERGIPCIKLDATPQGRPLYEKFGFLSEYEIERWMLKRRISSKVTPNSATSSEHVETAAPGCPAEQSSAIDANQERCHEGTNHLDDILRLDIQVFGADRTELLRSVAQAAPELNLVAGRETEITGYIFGRQGSLADHLGPWMARKQSAAAILLDEFLHRSTRDLIFVDCLQVNSWAGPLVRARGFELQRSLTRMFRGTNQYPGQPELLYAILGPEFG